MPQYYPNQDVICWVKAFITEAYEGALDVEQKADIRNDFYKVTRGWHTERFIYDWAWDRIAVPFGLQDEMPVGLSNALYNTWIASVDDHKDDPKQFSDELREIFDEDKEDEEDEYVDEPCSGDEDDYDYHECTDHKCRYKGHWHKKSTKKDEDEEDECDCGDCERCLADDTCGARCGDKGTINVTDQNGKECLVCKDCCDWFKNKLNVN